MEARCEMQLTLELALLNPMPTTRLFPMTRSGLSFSINPFICKGFKSSVVLYFPSYLDLESEDMLCMKSGTM